MLLHFFVQLPISFPVLLCYGLVGMHASLGVSFALILSCVSDRRELSLREHKLEDFFLHLLMEPPEKFDSWVMIRWRLLLLFRVSFDLFRFQRCWSFRFVYLVPPIVCLCLLNPYQCVFRYWCFITYAVYFRFIQGHFFSVNLKPLSFMSHFPSFGSFS